MEVSGEQRIKLGCRSHTGELAQSTRLRTTIIRRRASNGTILKAFVVCAFYSAMQTRRK
jgi:hypothetical protein